MNEYIAEVMEIIKNNPAAKEILVERVKPLRYAEKNGAYDPTFEGLNNAMSEPH